MTTTFFQTLLLTMDKCRGFHLFS